MDSYGSKQKHRCHRGAASKGTAMKWYLGVWEGRTKAPPHTHTQNKTGKTAENKTWGNVRQRVGNHAQAAAGDAVADLGSAQSVIITPGVLTHYCTGPAVSEEWNVKSRVSGYSRAQISDQRGGGVCNMKCSRSGPQPLCWMYVTSPTYAEFQHTRYEFPWIHNEPVL